MRCIGLGSLDERRSEGGIAERDPAIRFTETRVKGRTRVVHTAHFSRTCFPSPYLFQRRKRKHARDARTVSIKDSLAR